MHPKTMFTQLEQRSWIKIEVVRGRSTQECFQRLHKASGDGVLPYHTVARWVKAFRGKLGCSSGQTPYKMTPCGEQHSSIPCFFVGCWSPMDCSTTFIQHKGENDDMLVHYPIILHNNVRSHIAAAVMDLLHLLLHVPQQVAKTMTHGDTEPHHSSWQCKESHCCCHGPLVPLAMGDSGTSTTLTRYESMWLQSLRQSERITVRDPVQHKRWTYPCYRAVNMEHQQKWTHWWCTIPSKHLAKGDK